MRQIIVDYARRVGAKKRGGRDVRVSDTEADDLLDHEDIRVEERALEILAVDEALSRLAGLNARLGEVVELRFFGGFAIEEVSELLGISPRSVKRDWRTARAFLLNQLRGRDRE
jgi:RNA polymerase sigma factor (TIGR02999 family)